MANSLIKRTLAHSAGIETRFPERGFSKDRNWRALAPDAYFVDALTLRRRFPTLLAFTFVREPLARLSSCYRSKLGPGRAPGGLAREGLSTETSFPDFVRHVARRGDWRSNIHYRAQSSFLTPRDASPLDFVGRFETLHQDWARLTDIVADRYGTHLLPLPNPVKGHCPTDPAAYFKGNEALTALAVARYAEDYRLFYPDQVPI